MEDLWEEDACQCECDYEQLNRTHKSPVQDTLQVHGTSTHAPGRCTHASDAVGQTDTPTAAVCTAASAATMAPITTSAAEASAEPAGPEAMTAANVPGEVMDGHHQLAAAAMQAVARSCQVAGTADMSQAKFCSAPADIGLFACDQPVLHLSPATSTATCTHKGYACRSWPAAANTPEVSCEPYSSAARTDRGSPCAGNLQPQELLSVPLKHETMGQLWQSVLRWVSTPCKLACLARKLLCSLCVAEAKLLLPQT